MAVNTMEAYLRNVEALDIEGLEDLAHDKDQRRVHAESLLDAAVQELHVIQRRVVKHAIVLAEHSVLLLHDGGPVIRHGGSGSGRRGAEWGE